MTVSDQSRIVAIVADTPIRRSDLWDFLVHTNGKQALENAILDIGVTKELHRKGFVISKLDFERERELLVKTLQVVHFEEALELLWSSQSLAKSHVNKLIERNAGLRKLVSDDIKINDETIERMFQILHGPSAEARIILCRTREEAHQANEALQMGQRFKEVVAQYSTDNSRSNGGFIGEVIYADPQWPASLREQLKPLNVGSNSTPFLLDKQWVIVSKESEIAPENITLEVVRTEVAEIAKRAQERLRMDQLSKQILQTYKPSIFDEALQNSLSPNGY
mgnify:CR=1 FL=1